MPGKSLLMRICVLALPLLHLILLVGLILTPDGETGATFWQEFLPGPNNFFRHGLSFFGLLGIALLGALLLPPLSSWAVTRPRLRRVGLTGLWISLPLLLVAGLFNALSLKMLFFCFVASFILCLALALRLPRLDEQDQAALPATWEDATLFKDERSRHLHSPEREEPPLGWSPPLLALLGLLGYVPLFLSLPFLYIDTYDPYGGGEHFLFTGWQLLGGGFQAPLLLFTLIFTAFSYLVCLLSFLWRRFLTQARLQQMFVLNCLFNMVSIVLCMGLLFFSLIGDFDKQMHTMNAIAAVAPATFLFSLFCSSTLIGLFGLRRPKAIFS